MKDHMAKAAAALAIVTLALGGGDAAAKSQQRVKASACPSINVLTEATRITKFENGKIDLKAEIRDPEIGCTFAGKTAKSQLSFWVKSAIAPTSTVASRSVPYFVAIIANGNIIGKEVFTLSLPFSNDRKVWVKEKVSRIDIPIATGKTADDYSITIGFQLTPEQVEYNRTAAK
jgi:hypothetical protein